MVETKIGLLLCIKYWIIHKIHLQEIFKGVIIIKAVIMSGGMGTRLRPLTCHLPKPMVPIFNKPCMEYGIELLKKYGIEDIAITLYYLPDKIMEYFGDGSDFGVSLKYYIEDKPLGTGGSVKNAYEFLDDTFIVISGDAFTDIDLQKAYDFHKGKNSKATIVLKRENIPLEYGVVITDENGKVLRFLEKPSWGEVFSDTINTGIYILEPEVLDYYKVGENFDFSKDLFPKLLEDNIPLFGYISEEYWCDIGDLKSYIETHRHVMGQGDGSLVPPIEVKQGRPCTPIKVNQGRPCTPIEVKQGSIRQEDSCLPLWIGENTIIEKGAHINPPVYIGNNTTIKSGAIIEAYTVIGDNCIVGEGSSIKKSIIWDNVSISKNVEIRKAVICNNVFIGNRSRIFEGVAIGTSTTIGANTTIKPNIKIWPHKKVEGDVVIKKNLIWEKEIQKNLFGNRNIMGIFNQSINPENAAHLGTAMATSLGPRGTYIISCDGDNLSKSLKASIISGILSTGAQVIDIGNVTIPICRFGIKYFNGDGGLFIGKSFTEDKDIFIEILDHKGGNIDKNTRRKIENSIFIEDFKRVSGEKIQDIVTISNFSSIYLREGRGKLKYIDSIEMGKPKIIVSSPSENISKLSERFLNSIGCNVENISYHVVEKEEGMHNIVLDKNASLGILYSENGEGVEITDGFNIVSGEKYYLLNLLIGLKTGELEDALIPYNYPRIMDSMADEYKIEIEYGKSDVTEMIRALVNRENEFQYILNCDGILATGKLIEYLIAYDTTLNRLVQELPEYFYIKKTIPCKWDEKGNIIRRLSEENKGVELIEGVRFIEDKGWALLTPDEEKPIFNLYVEGYTEEYAEELGDFYNEKIKKMLKD